MKRAVAVYATALVTGLTVGFLWGYLKGLNDMDEAYRREAERQMRERYR
jgi:ABC-type dipeptide/oligopeptide/nickel transport system permease subunit